MAAPGLEVVLELLGQISRLEVPVEELRALRMAVQTLPPGALREWGPEFPLSGLFNLVALGNSEEISLSVAILEQFLQSMDPLYIICKFGQELQNGLLHPDSSVRIFTISQRSDQEARSNRLKFSLLAKKDEDQGWDSCSRGTSVRGFPSLPDSPWIGPRKVYVVQHPVSYSGQLHVSGKPQKQSTKIGRIVEDPDAVKAILNTPTLLKQVIYCIAAEKMAVAKEAIKSLSKIAETSKGLETLLAGNLLNDLKNMMAKSDIVRYRVYELVVDISSVSADSLNYCVNSGLIPQLIGELTGNDVLLRATCIEKVTSIAHTHHGRQYLAQQGIVNKISSVITEADSDPFSDFYLPGFVKFFGTLAVVDSPQQICERYPMFVEKVFSMAESLDPTMFGVAVDTLGILASKVEGKQVLHKMGGRFHHVLNRIGHQTTNAQTELRVRCLDAISSLLYLSPDQQTEDLLGMTESWFSCLSRQPLELFRSISTQPFPDLHCGALRVFTAIANQPWAQRMMIASPNFVEYIVDRSVEPDKTSKEAKYELINALANSKTIAEIFGNPHYLRLRAYLREGPYYVKAVSTTAVEGAE